MKTINLKKIVIPSLALLIGGAMAASISSTAAWFQYATSARVAYVGALSHCSKLLKISVDDGHTWGNDYYQNDMASHISGNHLLPITTGPQAKDSGLVYHQVDVGGGQKRNIVRFYSQPDFGFGGDYSKWHFASENNYAQFTILVKVNDVDGKTTPTTLVNDVYLNKIIIEDDSTNGDNSDLSDAVRVHLAVSDAANQTKYLLFSKSVETTEVSGEKTWVDGKYKDKTRPESITINLLADGEPALDDNGKAITANVTEGKDKTWKYSFTGLDKYKNGKVIKYKITENKLENYTTEINEYDVKNTLKTTEVSVHKTWIDAENNKKHPTIKINLYQNVDEITEETKPYDFAEEVDMETTVYEWRNGNIQKITRSHYDFLEES